MSCIHYLCSAICSPIRGVPDSLRLYLCTHPFLGSPRLSIAPPGVRKYAWRVQYSIIHRSIGMTIRRPPRSMRVQSFCHTTARFLRSCTQPCPGLLVHIRIIPPRVRKHSQRGYTRPFAAPSEHPFEHRPIPCMKRSIHYFLYPARATRMSLDPCCAIGIIIRTPARLTHSLVLLAYVRAFPPCVRKHARGG